jgi:putative ABC transport system permease protein
MAATGGPVGNWNLGSDLRHGLRTIRLHRGYTAAVIVMLALGIGATTAIFSVVKAVLINPLPYPDSERLVTIAHNIGGIDQDYFNDAIALTYADTSQAFASVGAWSPEATSVTITGQGEPDEVRALTASRSLFETLAVQPQLGRWFSAQEDTPGASGAVMISAGYWQQKFGRDPDVLSRTLTINGRPHHIVGVMPAGFDFAGAFEVVLPLKINAARPVSFFYLTGVARLKPGVTLEAAVADMSRVLEIYFDRFKANTNRAVRWQPTPTPLKDVVVGDAGVTLWVLMATIAFVLLMACANVATLLLIRSESRQQEFAIRASLGAPWTRIARGLLIDSLMLASIGGALGMALAYGGLRVLVAAAPANLPRLGEIRLDPPVIAFAIGITIACGVIFGVILIARVFGRRFTAAIGAGTRGASLTRERQTFQHGLVALQTALALVLLVSAGLMIRTYQALRSVEPGFSQPHQLQSFNVTFPAATFPDLGQVFRLQRGLLERVGTLPGVVSTAFTTRLPTDPNDRWSAALTIEDRPHTGKGAPPNHQVKVISPGTFQTFGTSLVAGRDFTWTDLEELREVAIVSENLARQTWGSAEAAIGKRVRQFYGSQKAPFREIVGVAADVHDDGVQVEAPMTVYWPARLSPFFGGYQPRRVAVVLRTDRAGTQALANELREAVRAVSPDLPLAQLRTVGQLYDRSLSRTSFTLAMLAVAGAMALLLGVAGIYGVVAYAVSQRRREIGIRVALGAQPPQVRALFVRRGLIVAATGGVLGLAGAAAFTRALQSLLFGVEPFDPLTFAMMPLVLAITAAVATYLPAQRALSVDPVETMRAE